MTIANTTNKITFTGDGSQTVFSFSPLVVQQPAVGADHALLVVKRDASGNETTLTEGTTAANYSVSVPTYPGTGEITYPAASGTPLTASESLIIKQNVPQTQPTDLENLGPYNPETQEDQYDRFAIVDKQQQEELDRSFKTKITTTGVDPEMPDPEGGKVLGWNVGGTKLVNLAEAPTASASDATPQPISFSAGAPGASADYSRADHVHLSPGLETDTTPQLGGDLDANTFDILFDSGTGIRDENDNEQLLFITVASAVNYVDITNAATTNGPTIAAKGSDANIDLNINPKGTGSVTIDGLKWPTADGTPNQVIETDGAGNLSFTDRATNPNFLINPIFDIWRRGSSFATPAAGDYTADRWVVDYDGTIGTFSIDRNDFAPGQTDVDAGEPNHYLTWDHTVAGSASTFRQIQQRVEDVRTFNGDSATVSFWAKADSARDVDVFLRQHFGTGGTPSGDVDSASQTANLTTSWQKFTLTFSVASISGKTIGTDNNDYLAVVFDLPLNTTMTIDLAAMKFERGVEATPLLRPTLAQAIQECARYFQKTFLNGTAPAQSAGVNGSLQVIAATGGRFLMDWQFTTRLRTDSPTITTYNPSAANGDARNFTDSTDTAVTVTDSSDRHVAIVATSPVAGDAGDRMQLHVTADAEL